LKRWHITQNGEIQRCHAVTRGCPLNSSHFSDVLEAEEYFERLYSWDSSRPTFNTYDEFMAYQDSRGNVFEEAQIARFGIPFAVIPRYDYMVDWQEIPEEFVMPNSQPIFTSQDEVSTRIVTHYIESPDEPSGNGTSLRDGVAIRMVRDENGALHILDGNHRFVAAKLLNRAFRARIIDGVSITYPDDD